MLTITIVKTPHPPSIARFPLLRLHAARLRIKAPSRTIETVSCHKFQPSTTALPTKALHSEREGRVAVALRCHKSRLTFIYGTCRKPPKTPKPSQSPAHDGIAILARTYPQSHSVSVCAIVAGQVWLAGALVKLYSLHTIGIKQWRFATCQNRMFPTRAHPRASLNSRALCAALPRAAGCRVAAAKSSAPLRAFTL